MKIGVVFPQIEMGTDVGVIREYATTAESLGYSHILAYDHVLGANTASRPDWQGPYTSDHTFHEPMVLFSYLAAITEKMEMVSGIIILPQRQTALVAKQAACLDVLSGGRFRLGIGTGWNQVEYEGLGENFRDRGKRSEEQIELMRRLWAEDTITFNGKWHQVTDAGINPRPIHGRIPVWLGGMAPQVIERVGRIADGWFPMVGPGEALTELITQVRQGATDAGRNPDDIGIESGVPASDSVDKNLERLHRYAESGVTHLSVQTMYLGLSPAEHIERIGVFAEAIRQFDQG